jgi:16S rRNA (cytosine1402-N4)-methyltransferase
MQIDEGERGFSFREDGPLDMRMSQEGPSAADFLNTADEAEIARVIRIYGDEPRAKSLARAIVAARPLTRTSELSAVCRKVLGWHAGMKTDPATRTFQAIRIHVNADWMNWKQGCKRPSAA